MNTYNEEVNQYILKVIVFFTGNMFFFEDYTCLYVYCLYNEVVHSKTKI